MPAHWVKQPGESVATKVIVKDANFIYPEYLMLVKLVETSNEPICGIAEEI
jgi:hypothetical protein